MITVTDYGTEFTLTKCQQCGACISVCPKEAIINEPLKNGLQNIIIDNNKCIKCLRCVSVCPAYRDLVYNDYLEKIHARSFFLSSNINKKIRHESSSGGTCKTLIIEGLKSNLVDGVYSLRKLNLYPSAEGEFYTKANIPSDEDIPNSVYHSIMACKEIGKVKKVNRLMIVGTSCQLYALEKTLKGKYEEIIKVCIFCKQQKTFESTNWLAKVMGVPLPKQNKVVTKYRGDGWPGTIRVMNKTLSWEKAAALPFGRRLWCVPGCDICGDPFGLEIGADITLMDPWVIRKSNDLGETLTIVHSQKGEELLTKVSSLAIEPITYDEAKPALGLQDVWRKRVLVPYYKGDEVSAIIRKAGVAETEQRSFLEKLLGKTPKLPFIFYRLLNKALPKRRDQILKINQV